MNIGAIKNECGSRILNGGCCRILLIAMHESDVSPSPSNDGTTLKINVFGRYSQFACFGAYPCLCIFYRLNLNIECGKGNNFRFSHLMSGYYFFIRCIISYLSELQTLALWKGGVKTGTCLFLLLFFLYIILVDSIVVRVSVNYLGKLITIHCGGSDDLKLF